MRNPFRRPSDTESRLAAQLARAKREREAASLVHHDYESYTADLRVGAQFVDARGVVKEERVPTPVRSHPTWARVITPWNDTRLPDGHPRRDEDRSRSSSSLLRDAFDPWSGRGGSTGPIDPLSAYYRR